MSARVAIVDSGINLQHAGIGAIAGGIAIAGPDLTDHLGHGTAVAARIRELAPEVELYIVKVFDRALACPIDTLVRAIEWCIEERVDFVNLSLGTGNRVHTARLTVLVERARSAGVQIVAPAGSLPGDLEGVCRAAGVSSSGSLSGVSFAVAELTARLANL